jgi:TRAP-type C4-dicarboxylate transport system permease small subunit
MNRSFHNLLAGLNTLASVWVLFIVLLVSADVICRGAFNAPIPGVPEIVRFSIVGMVWLQMAYTLRSGNHLRTTLVLGIMPAFGQRLILVVNSLVGVGLFVLITWLGWIEMMKTWEIGAFEGEHPVRIPIWPIWGILVGGAALTALQFALDAVRYLREGPRSSELSDVADASTPV